MTARGSALAGRWLSVPGGLFFTVASAAVPFPFYLPPHERRGRDTE